MAKKSFKGGLGSLLENTFNKTGLDKQNVSEPKDDREFDELKLELDICKAELALWRQGQLDMALFKASLAEEGLKYNSETNSIEKED